MTSGRIEEEATPAKIMEIIAHCLQACKLLQPPPSSDQCSDLTREAVLAVEMLTEMG